MQSVGASQNADAPLITGKPFTWMLHYSQADLAVNQSALLKCCTGLGQPNAVDLLSLSACNSATASGLSARWPENRCASTRTPRPPLKSPAKKPDAYAASFVAPTPLRQRSTQTHRPHRVRAGHAFAVALATGSRPSRWVTGSRQAGSIWRWRRRHIFSRHSRRLAAYSGAYGAKGEETWET